MNQKPLALAAVGYSDGLRAFIHPGNGNVRVVGNEAEVKDILSYNHSENAKKGKWEPGTLQASCDTQSNLAAFEGQDGLILGLCCQQCDDNNLALYRRDYKWRRVAELQRARPGTALAAVSSIVAAKVVLFFQDEGDYVCCLRGTREEAAWRWDNAVRLGEAAPGCGIAATSWKRDEGLEEIGLYYQDAHLKTVELRLSFSECRPSEATPPRPIPFREAGPEAVSMQVLAAVSWGSTPRVRVYLRDNGNIWVFHQIVKGTRRRWDSKLMTLGNISSNSNLAAVARTSGDSDDVVIDLLYWSASKTLNHKLFVNDDCQENRSIGLPLAILPPQGVDPYDMAFSGNTIRVEAFHYLIGVRDAFWTLCNHVRWLKKEAQAASQGDPLLKLFATIGSDMFQSTPQPPKHVLRHLSGLGDLVVRLSGMAANGDKCDQDELLQKCQVQARRVEVAIESWPDMCDVLDRNIKVATCDIEDVHFSGTEALEDRFNDLCEVMSSTVARGNEPAFARRSVKIMVSTALIESRRDALELDELRVFIRRTSRNAAGQLRTKLIALKTGADRIAERFSTLSAKSTTLPFQSSAQDFARVIVDMLGEINGIIAPNVPHVLSGLKRQLEAVREGTCIV